MAVIQLKINNLLANVKADGKHPLAMRPPRLGTGWFCQKKIVKINISQRAKFCIKTL